MQSLEFLKAWREKARTWQGQVPAPESLPDTAAMEGSLMLGEPLITLTQPALPADLFARVLADLAGLYAGFAGGDQAAGASALEQALRGASVSGRAALVEGVLAGGGVSLEEWAEQHGVAYDTLVTLAGLALQPFMARFAAALTDVAPIPMWRQNYCPVCASAPAVCRIDPDNLRFLHCPQCDTQWEHHRLTCAVCDTDNIKQVRLLTVESLEPWRVEVCDDCGGYIKTLDQRHGGHLAMPKVDLFVEDARTLTLNLLAEEEGYRRGGRKQ